VDMTSMALIKLLLKAPTSWDVLEQLMNGKK
jgi:hypothetical protein